MMHNAGITTRDLFLRSCYRHPQRTALVDRGHRFSYQELDREANRLANALAAAGLEKADRVALYAKNCMEFVASYLAAARLGAVLIPLNYRCVAAEIEFMLDDCRPRVLMFEDEYAPIVASIKDRLPSIARYIAIGSSKSGFAIPYGTLVSASGVDEPDVEISEDDECAIIYTSGTSGRQKGAIYTHRTRVACTVNTLLGGSVDVETILLAGPLCHAGPLNAFLANLAIGATTVIIPRLHADDIAQTIETEKVNHLYTVPTVLHNLIETGALERYDFSSLRKIRYGGSSIAASDLEILLRRLPEVKFYQGYGGTEPTQLAILGPEDHVRKFGCTGKAHLLVDLRVVDEATGRDVAPGDIGEVITRGPHVMKGYLNLPEENAQRLSSGWYRTGDMARIDEEGFLTVIGRKEDMIISGGENIYPREVERVLLAHPGIADAAVFGMPDDKWGHLVCAAVIVSDRQSVTESELTEFCKQRLASYKKPSRIRFFDSFPVSTSGKVLKDRLRQSFFER